MITICLTYFKSLALVNLAAALYSVRHQNLKPVEEIIVLDNDTFDTVEAIQSEIDTLEFPVPVRLVSHKHWDNTKTHSWSTNVAVREAKTPWILFTRADYLLDFHAVDRFAEAAIDTNRFIVSGYYDVYVDIGVCETMNWRQHGPQMLKSVGREYDHVLIDSGVWCTTREVFDRVGGLDERLVAWGHAQTHFQYKVFEAGVEFIRLPQVLFYHPAHGHIYPRDHATAQLELRGVGPSVQEMWTRYTGQDNPYR